MSITVLIGAQWGDEGKGKIIDVLTRRADWIVRFQGGNNAGHTVEFDGRKYVLHLVPSGILQSGKSCIIGPGLVVNPLGLVEELDQLSAQGISFENRFYISDRAHLVLPCHLDADLGREKRAADGKRIGTTGRGIGPAYADKANRVGLRFGDIMEPDFEERVRDRFAELAENSDDREIADRVASVQAAVSRLRPYIADSLALLRDARREGAAILLEGAQGTMLDVDHGTYPFVTSSSTCAGGAIAGAPVPPAAIDRVVGVLKAYTTRVGEGPFPTELLDADGDFMRSEGGEYGATTGRPRRCGWFDAVVARYAAELNGCDFWALTKLDVLDRMDVIRIATAYELDGRRIDNIPASSSALARCKPVYEEMPGWRSSTRDIACWEDLPAAAQDYIRRLEALTGVKAGIISTGPGRERTLLLEAAGGL